MMNPRQRDPQVNTVCARSATALNHYEQQICLECKKPFCVRRIFKNRNAVIRYCRNCKEDFDYVRQTDQTVARGCDTVLVKRTPW